MEATVILSKCPKQKLMYGIRTQKMNDGDWWRTWAFPIDERRAKKEGYDITRIQGSLYHTEGYLGCPYCGTKSFVQCNKCQKISCWNGEIRLNCEWCGNDMDNIVSTTEKVTFNLSGGDI